MPVPARTRCPSEAFDWWKLPKTLRVAIDSSPLEGAGRVEDTLNLLGHAGRKIVACASALLRWTDERVCREAGVPLLLESSIKKGLDLDWSDHAEKTDAVPTLVEQLTRLEKWIAVHLPEEMKRPPLKDQAAAASAFAKAFENR
jgi:hypothetical protein